MNKLLDKQQINAIFDFSFENLLQSKFGEGDHICLLYGIDNLVLFPIKITIEILNLEFLEKVAKFLPIGIGIIGLLFIQNDDLYFDSDDISNEIITKLNEYDQTINCFGIREIFINENEKINKFFFHFVVKEILYQTNLEFEESYIKDLSDLNAKNEIKFVFNDCLKLLKNDYCLVYNKIILSKNFDKNQKTFIDNFAENKAIFKFSEKLVIEYKDVKDLEDKNHIKDMLENEMKYKNLPNSIFTNYSQLFEKLKLKNINKDDLFLFSNEIKFDVLINDNNDFHLIGLKDEILDISMNVSDLFINYECLIYKFSNPGSFVTNMNKLYNKIIGFMKILKDSYSEHEPLIQFINLKKLIVNPLFHSSPLLLTNNQEDNDFLSQKFYFNYNEKLLQNYYPVQYSLIEKSNKLFNVHTSLNEKLSETSKCSFVKGLYEYYHYLQDKWEDVGWGCAYRSLQCLYSWYLHNGIFNTKKYKDTPSILDIQKALVEAQDKSEKIINSNDWIGSFEITIVLNHFLNVECKVIFLSNGSEIKSKGREIMNHFNTVGSPIMIGGGSFAYTIVGINYDYTTGDCKFLILDPHYKEKDDINAITAQSGISWKTEKFFDKSNFYNMCLPQLSIN